ncbi:MAG: ArgP/LysG family DNA-binding transcriptional regulator, partial [Hydrogenophaga sp.]
WRAVPLTRYAAEAPVWLEVSVDDQDHTAGWLRTGAVMAAVTSTEQAGAGCNSEPLGAMRYLAVASPPLVERHFSAGVNAASLARAPSLVFNAKDGLQLAWAERQQRRRG